MNRFTGILLLILIAGLVNPVDAQTQDVVYLKNGGIVRGIIIEQVPNASIKIQTRDGNVLVFRMDEIERLTKERPATAASEDVKSGAAARVSVGTDVSGELAFGGGFSYAWGNVGSKSATEVALFGFYAPEGDLFVGGLVANWLVNYTFHQPSVYFVVGSGVAIAGIEDYGSAAALLTNVGIGGAFGGGPEVRLETPLLLAIGEGGGFAATVTLSVLIRF